MEFCGGHTHAISRYGVADLLPAPVRMIHGPGCPVCVLPIGRIDLAIRLALEQRRDPVHLRRLPARAGLEQPVAAEGQGTRRRRAHGLFAGRRAEDRAGDHPEREVVFFAIGFETTTPPTALVIKEAARLGLANFSVLCNHVLTPAAITNILESPEVRELGTLPLDGFIGPAHVSTIIGSQPYEFFAEEYRKPVVIAGFEPLDVMQAILMLVRQINEGRAEVENEFTRAVTREGNLKAQALVSEVFELRRSFEWRGLGQVPYSALRIREAFAAFDAERRFKLETRSVADNKACECGAILRGVKHPRDCKVFGTVCTPENPIGSCMVSSEGACAAYYSYGRFKDAAIVVRAGSVNAGLTTCRRRARAVGATGARRNSRRTCVRAGSTRLVAHQLSSEPGVGQNRPRS